MSGRDRRGRVSVLTCQVTSGYCRDISGEVGLVSGRVRLSPVIDGTYLARSA